MRQRRDESKTNKQKKSVLSSRLLCGQLELNSSREQCSQPTCLTCWVFIHQLPQSVVEGCSSAASISWNFWLAPQVGRVESSSQREPSGNEIQMLAMKSQVCVHRNVRHKAIWMEAPIATALVCLFEMREKVIDTLNMNLLLCFRIWTSYSCLDNH